MRNPIQPTCLICVTLILLLSGCTHPSSPVSTPTMTALTVSAPTFSANVSTPTVMFARSTDLITASGFQFQICKVMLDDAVKMLTPSACPGTSQTVIPTAEGHPITAHRGGLVFTAGGDVPKNPTGDAVLILYVKLKVGDMEKFLEVEPKIIEKGTEKSAVEVMTDDVLKEVYWVYDVSKSSHFSFLLRLPDNTILDLQRLMMMSNPPMSNP